ncbi:MAG: hypothetical protein AB1609_00810 [Bacillota bacterium]
MLSFHRLDGFSFKDLLAAIFVTAFLVEVFRGNEAMVDLMVPLVGIILGGYFATEGYSYWLERQGRQGRRQGSRVAPEPTMEEVDPNGPF